MKIGVVCYPTFGGSGVVATELGIELSKKGHEVHFITYSQPVRLDALSSNLHYHEVNVPDYPLFKYEPYELALSSKLFDVISKHKIDVLHVHYAIPHAYAAYMAKKILKENGYNIPIITTLHGTDITLVGNNPFYKPAVTFSINKSDIVTCVSKSLMEDTREFFGIKREIKVIPNFIDIDKYAKKHNLCQGNLLAQDDEKIIVHVSNFRPLKRIIDVIKIFEKINQKINSKLIMVGDGPDKKKAKEFLRKNNLKNKVIFLGKTNEVDEILCSSDLFLLPSEKESFGLAALEAMALKVPVISTNTGGLKDLNINGNSGYTSDIGDIDSMAENAIKILSDTSLEKKYRNQAFENAKKYDIKTVIPLYEKIYDEALNMS
ncbi:N-acetyl-alpha-D-glucosaminyl L-malate synthase BshA [Flavobacteriaceae bacterium]|nr:N-acetyl-alpha-D-glucosaminyl L-malate synthase BshA [Flavobacteriaceae bacterium]MDA8934815.1 N-acetyl-alpha-D-glucosaminyl L-malate synthase BshA [Flavobacteriaceae bacterium]MDB2366596.1 N-acetyl-alpha-D-glucosaminyl L-malate synthase BshA [Flavobacteriaceae bacterium]MDB3874639.1 N-acetyl-alpha-D-glucosaminyl L-malate synthase BshA [Flavobacteriaceae bacterium]MDC0923548.1 N-acetyl-alpha-D-glucosaminyl L-malate synthase BshA [Flavobacteriaceae bacterium]|tara:strand:+ start:1038 stop:2165 length:1128 start_codon:yes stop_codon:yes gene_type:complete